MITSIAACASTACHTGWMPSTTNAASRRRCLRSASRRTRLTSGFAALVITSVIGMRAYSAATGRPAHIVATHQQAVLGPVRKERQMGAESERVAGFGRLEHGLRPAGDWYRWGPYVSERQWGTVREDYSPDGEAWDYLPHDHARSRAYRWGEDGLAGFCGIE